MKKFWLVTLSILIGSILTLVIIYAFNPISGDLKIEHVSKVPSRTAFYTIGPDSALIPLNFVEVSKNVMVAVVNIQSTQNLRQAQRGRGHDDEQMRQFFDEEFFRYFFGPDAAPEGQRRRESPQQQVGVGSGVIINEKGYIVTNNHVVANASDIDVTLYDNRTYKAEIVGTDPTTDLALIKINETKLPVIPMANSDEAQIGEWVLAVGNPYGLTSTVTAGIISAKSRSLNILAEKYAIESFIQTDAAINPGNSGGALVNLQGGLVGINTAIASPTGSYSGYGFAVSSNLVNKVVEDLIQFGAVKRAYLGISLRNITGKFARENKLKINQGAYVDSIMPEGAAAKSGLKKGDIIIVADGKRVQQSSELQEIIAIRRPGDKIDLLVNRNGEELKLSVVLKGLDEGREIVANNKGKTSLESLLGAKLQNIENNLAKKLSIPGGVKITNLQEGGRLTNQTDIREGFIITKVNDQPIKSVEELQSLLEKRKGGVLLEGVYENLSGTFYYAFGL